MCGGCCRSNVRSGTLTSFIAKESAFDTIHHRSTQSTTSNLFKAKSILNDKTEDRWNKLNIHDDYHQSKEDITYCHQRNKNTADLCNALNTTEDYYQRKYCKNNTHPYWGNGESLIHSATDGVTLYGDISHTEG